MIEPSYHHSVNHYNRDHLENKKILSWQKNDRMGGQVPVWENHKSQKQQMADMLSYASFGEMPPGQRQEALQSSLSYAAKPYSMNSLHNQDAFGFSDLIDMVNPLQHIPLVNHVYRELTGDDIKPISKIIGGGVFGGVAGAAGALVGTVVEYETGRDIPSNLIALASRNDDIQYRSQYNFKRQQADALEALPGSVIRFADLGAEDHQKLQKSPRKVLVAEGRTAGKMM